MGFYLYLLKKDNFDSVPPELLRSLGKLDFSLEFNLHEGRKLAKEDPAIVISNLKKLGFHLQITDPLAAPEAFKLR